MNETPGLIELGDVKDETKKTDAGSEHDGGLVGSGLSRTMG